MLTFIYDDCKILIFADENGNLSSDTYCWLLLTYDNKFFESLSALPEKSTTLNARRYMSYDDVLISLLEGGELANDAKFELVYIDDDDIPELVYNTSSAHPSGVTIYSKSKSDVFVKKLVYCDPWLGTTYSEFGEFGYAYYLEKSGKLLDYHRQHEEVTAVLYNMNDLQLHHIAKFHDYWGHGINNFYIND